MSTQLFGPPNAGGSFADKLRQAQDFMNGARGKVTADVAGESITHGLAAEAPIETVAAAAPDAGPGAAAPTGIDAAVPVTTAAGHDPDGLAAAARAAAEQSIADPNYTAAAQQQVEVIVQPRVMVQGQQGPIIVPVDVAVPAAHTNVTVAPAQAVVLDAATGQVVAAPQAPAAQAADAAAPTTRGFRSWGIEDLANLGRGRGAAPAAPAPQAAAPAAAAAAESAPAASGGGWRAQINDAIIAARGPAASAPAAEIIADAPAAAAPASGGGWRSQINDAIIAARGPAIGAPAAEVVSDAPKAAGLLDRIRANTADLGAVLSRTAPDVAPIADDAAKAAKPGVGAALRAAVEAAKIAR